MGSVGRPATPQSAWEPWGRHPASISPLEQGEAVFLQPLLLPSQGRRGWERVGRRGNPQSLSPSPRSRFIFFSNWALPGNILRHTPATGSPSPPSRVPGETDILKRDEELRLMAQLSKVATQSSKPVPHPHSQPAYRAKAANPTHTPVLPSEAGYPLHTA